MLWLGGNMAVAAAYAMGVRETPGDGSPADLSLEERTRARWNILHPNDFAAEYDRLLAEVDRRMRANREPSWRVFVVNVPRVTSAPVLRGVGRSRCVNGSVRFERCTFPPFDEGAVESGAPSLSGDDVLRIDKHVEAYGEHAARAVARANAAHPMQRYVLVDVAAALDALAWQKNDGRPTSRLPPALAALDPPPDARFYHADETGRVVQGGLVSLGGVHPSAIGQGLLAHELLVAMRAGVPGADPDALPWSEIIAADAVYRDPIRILRELYARPELTRALFQPCRLLGLGRAHIPPFDIKEL